MILEKKFGQLTALVKNEVGTSKQALVLLHGVGSNEQNILDVGLQFSSERQIISLRAPLVMGPQAYGWFHVQFTPQGPVHNWAQASDSFLILEDSLRAISEQTGIAMNKISVFGFSQGAIMTLGLALQSQLPLESYIACSGRVLPEFEKASIEKPISNYQDRKILVAHGQFDSKLPIVMGRNTERILRSANLNLVYKEYQAEHVVPQELVSDTQTFLST